MRPHAMEGLVNRECATTNPTEEEGQARKTAGSHSHNQTMSYLSLYRKYRAQQFDEVMGQSHITTTLRNAIRQQKWAHAYLFCGPRGTGKTTTARLLAKALNCEQGPTPDPCGTCRFCETIKNGTCVDVVEMDAASETGIDDVRSAIIENAKYPPMDARYKIYIIDEVHDLSAKAFDALLKTIEEPPPHVLFVLATTEFTKVPVTIRSRCQRFDFHRGSITDITARLEFVVQAEGLEAEPAALNLIARVADGSWRDALTALEQVIAFSEGVLTPQTVYQALGVVEDETLYLLIDALAERKQTVVLELVDAQLKLGREPRAFAESLIAYLRTLIQIALNATGSTQFYDPAQQASMFEQANRVGVHCLLRWWERLTETLNQMKTSGTPRILLELNLLLICEQVNTPIPGASTSVEPPTTLPQPVRQAGTPASTHSSAASAKEEETAAAAAPPVQQEPDDDENGTGNLQQWWSIYLQRMREKAPRMASMLDGSQLVIDHEKQATIFVRSPLAEQSFTKDEKRAHTIAEAIAKRLQVDKIYVRFKVKPDDASAVPEPPPAQETAMPTLEGQNLIDGIKETFNGQEIN